MINSTPVQDTYLAEPGRRNHPRKWEVSRSDVALGAPEEQFYPRVALMSFWKAGLKKYRKFLLLPMKDYVGPVGGERLSTERKGVYPGPMNDFEDIVEAFARLAGNIDKLT